MKKYLTIGEGIERGIAAIDSGKLQWGRNTLFSRPTGRYSVLEAAAYMEGRAGGIGRPLVYVDALIQHTSPNFVTRLFIESDYADTWSRARAQVYALLAKYPEYTSLSPARDYYENKKGRK